jgi:hypothetical protein
MVIDVILGNVIVSISFCGPFSLIGLYMYISTITSQGYYHAHNNRLYNYESIKDAVHQISLGLCAKTRIGIL